MEISLGKQLPKIKDFNPSYRRAPYRHAKLTSVDKLLAVNNALRYVPQEHHTEMADEFLAELKKYGRIYAYRYRPEGALKAGAIHDYQGKCLAGKAIQLMINNNLDFDIALYPYELVTYGETGQVCQNWLQYQLIMKYLQKLNENQTLVIQSGHPLGLFRSPKSAPRVILTNSLMVGEFDTYDNWSRAAAIGVANYGQMTAGGFMYIGPQGIVHGTYNTISIAGRKKLNIPEDGNLASKLFVTSGLGGMSGAQGKAIEIAGGVGVIAEVDESRVNTRLQQGWIHEVCNTPKAAFDSARIAQSKSKAHAIAFLGNVVDLLAYAVQNNIKIDLLTDQTSCHAPYDGGYCPFSLSFAERTKMLETNLVQFKKLVNESLVKHFEYIKALTENGTYFFDYGNSFMKAVFDAGVTEIAKNNLNTRDGFIWPSYVEDILGPELFDYGYGPFRWVCLSGKEEDLELTDQVAAQSIAKVREKLRYQDVDNINWVNDAKKNKLVVGSQARILYQDAKGRQELALEFNSMVRENKIGPVMLGRDHHDTGGTDSPFRETSNIKDGSQIMADMATSVFAGNCARGMTLVALHNGGGVGIAKSINGGYGLLLDGSSEVDEIITTAVPWDVMGGVARRSWARNKNAMQVSSDYNSQNKLTDYITLPNLVNEDVLELLKNKINKENIQ